MTRPLASPERAAFYDDSHILTQESALAKHRAWEAGELVTSQMVAIGRITPTQEEENFFQSRQLLRNDYRLIEPNSNLRGIQLLGDALLTIVQQDMERGNLQGELVHKIHAGYYRITYTVKYGIPTISAIHQSDGQFLLVLVPLVVQPVIYKNQIYYVWATCGQTHWAHQATTCSQRPTPTAKFCDS